MAPVNWRHIYVSTIVLRFLFGLSDSYIHPDEHFQTIEILTAKFFNFSTNIPWEFTIDQPARSMGPLYAFYGPLYGLIKLMGIQMSPLALWYLTRVQLILVSWLVTDMCLYRILPNKPERIKAVFFTLTSYMTLVYQSHTFSNSLETPLVLICVMILSDLRFAQEVVKLSQPDYQRLFYFGIVAAIGVFNRITFPAFLLFPSYFLLKYIGKFKLGGLVVVAGAMIPSILFVLLDTYEYKGQILTDLVITPLNNLLYNTKYDNLAVHGIHPIYTHVLVNLPQILGPLLVVLFYKFRNSYYKTVPFLSFTSGLLVLSIIPHQELRFLTPLLPLACCCLDFKNIDGKEITKSEQKEDDTKNTEKIVTLSSNLASSITILWYVFNIFMCILMGIFHQGGIIPALDYSHHNLIKKDIPFVQIWWRTYSPPMWVLGDTKNKTKMVTLNQFDSSDSENLIIDAMGTDQQNIYKLIDQVKSWQKKIMIVAPIASMNCDFETSSVKLVWKTNQHVDLDHLNFDSLECLTPGLGIYELI